MNFSDLTPWHPRHAAAFEAGELAGITVHGNVRLTLGPLLLADRMRAHDADQIAWELEIEDRDVSAAAALHWSDLARLWQMLAAAMHVNGVSVADLEGDPEPAVAEDAAREDTPADAPGEQRSPGPRWISEAIWRGIQDGREFEVSCDVEAVRCMRTGQGLLLEHHDYLDPVRTIDLPVGKALALLDALRAQEPYLVTLLDDPADAPDEGAP